MSLDLGRTTDSSGPSCRKGDGRPTGRRYRLCDGRVPGRRRRRCGVDRRPGPSV